MDAGCGAFFSAQLQRAWVHMLIHSPGSRKKAKKGVDKPGVFR